MNTKIGSECTPEAMFNAIGGWTTQFDLNGKKVGGDMEILTIDPRLYWHIEQVGGIAGKRVLELGPLEGAHTKMMVEAGVREVVAIEGLSDCFLRCLIVKEAFELNNVKFLFGDFCEYMSTYTGEKFDLISAAGVLYHQPNPAQLIHDMAKVTDRVFVWSHVASDVQPSNMEVMIAANGITYKGKARDWGGLRLSLEKYCASIKDYAVWLYPEDMLKCFKDAGFVNIVQKDCPVNPNGSSLLFVATK